MFQSFFLKSSKRLKKSNNYIWLDLDINNRYCNSVGHHIIRYNKNNKLINFDNSCNLNELVGRSIKKKFKEKYPLGTIHFLMWLYEQEIPDKKNADKLIWLADSAFINSQSHKFRNNAKNWIKNIFPVSSIIDSFNEIDELEFEKEMKEYQTEVRLAGFEKGHGQTKSRHLGLTGFQCQPKNIPEDIINLINYISNLTGWNFKSEQINLKNLICFGGKRKRKYLTKDFDLDRFLAINKNIFSYVFTFQNVINYTIFDKYGEKNGFEK